MKKVYSLKDIDCFLEVLASHKDYIMKTDMTKRQLDSYLRNLRNQYYSKCIPIGYL